ncbi:hypothetical protein FX016_07020 [Cupriavidus gilardii]|nr:hypothetical protein FX016_07020 [Cupriavidus gilardii]
MATFIGTVKKTDYEQFYNEVRNNPGDFVKRVLGQNAAGAEPSGRFQIGENIFTLTWATKGKTRQLCIRREFENGESLVQTRLMQLMDFLFFRSSTRTMERALRSGSTITTGLVKDMRAHVDRIVDELWPDIEARNAEAGQGPSDRRGNAVPTNRAISERTLGSLAPLNPGEIDAWIRCAEGGPVGLAHIDRSKTRIEGDILVLSFKSGGDAIEFRLHAPSVATHGKERVQRDMERLLRIAKGQRQGCDYRNMAELMGRFMVATIEDEAPRLLEASASAIVRDDQDNDVRPLMICTVKKGRPEPTRTTRRALARAVDKAMASCRASAAQRFQTILNGVCRDKGDPVVSTVLDARERLIEKIQQKVKPHLAGKRLAAFVREVVRQCGVNGEAAQALHADRAAGSALPARVRLVHFTRKPGLLERLSGDAPGEEVLAVASREDGEALRFVPLGQRNMAKWAWKTIKLAEVPKDVESDARALHQTVFDSSLGRFYQNEILPLVMESVQALREDLRFQDTPEGDAAKDLLLKLTGNLRIGNTTFAYLHRWAGDADRAARVAPGQNDFSADRVIMRDEDAARSGPVAADPVSQRQAAAYALRQDLKNVFPRLANVTEADCNKPVTLYKDGKFESLPVFQPTGPNQQGDQRQWRSLGNGSAPNQQSEPSSSASKVPTEKVPTEKVPTEKVPTEKVPTEKVPTEKVPV